MRTMLRILTTTLAVLLAQPLAAQQEQADFDHDGSVAFFGITYLDESIQTEELGRDPAETARIEMLEDMVAQRFEEEGMTLVDLGPVSDKIERTTNPAKCNGCDSRMAEEIGAEYSLVGEVQKVSNLILSMNLQMRDAATGEMVRGRVVDIRSNTDESWRRGMDYILRNTFFTKEEEEK